MLFIFIIISSIQKSFLSNTNLIFEFSVLNKLRLDCKVYPDTPPHHHHHTHTYTHARTHTHTHTHFFNERNLKMIKNAFYFILKFFSFSLYLNFCVDFRIMQKKRLDQKYKVNFKIYNVKTWLTNNYHTHIFQHIFSNIFQVKGTRL